MLVLNIRHLIVLICTIYVPHLLTLLLYMDVPYLMNISIWGVGPTITLTFYYSTF